MNLKKLLKYHVCIHDILIIFIHKTRSIILTRFSLPPGLGWPHRRVTTVLRFQASKPIEIDNIIILYREQNPEPCHLRIDGHITYCPDGTVDVSS